MLGKIGIENLCIHCIIGCNAHERVLKQDIFLDLQFKYNFSACVLSDDLKDTINYVEIADMCTEIALAKPYFLLESLAHTILEKLISELDIEWAFIRIKKPNAIPSADYAVIELEKYKER